MSIKKEKISNEESLYHINKELNYLKPFIEKYNNIFKDKIIQLMILLKNINMQLWKIEDKIRIKEKLNEFDEEFIILARSVYKTNDQRYNVKNEINTFLNSDIKEIKSYVQYNNE